MKRLLLLGFTLLAASTSYSQEMLVLSEEYTPYQYNDEQGQLTGFGIELITLIFKEAGITMQEGQIQIYPWARTYKMLLETENSVAFMTTRNDQRENLLKWVGPLAPRKMWLYKLRERTDIRIETLEDAKKYVVGGYRSSQTDYLIELGFPNLEIVPQEKLNIRKLLKGRVDLISSLELTIVARLKDMGLSYDVVEKAILFDGRFDYYLAINQQTSDALVNRMQDAFDKIKQSGAYDKIKNTYLK